MKNIFRRGEIILSFTIIALLGAAVLLADMRTNYQEEEPTRLSSHETVMWVASYQETDFASSEIRELVRQLQHLIQNDRDAVKLRPVIIQLGVHIRQASEPVPPVVADLLRDLSVEHPVSDIRLIAYTTMISALQNEAGVDGAGIGLALR
jgi:hypothetical protein